MESGQFHSVTRGKAMTLTLRRGLCSFVWLQGRPEPHIANNQSLTRAFLIPESELSAQEINYFETFFLHI
jgi:hypothetical protein